MVEGSVACGEGGFAAVLGDDEGVGSEEGFAAGAAEEAEGGLVLVGGLVGWVEVDDFDGGSFGEALEEGSSASVFEGVAVGDLEGGEVGAEGGQGEVGVFRKPDVGGSAGDGLDADGSGAGVKIDKAAGGDAWRDDVEEGFAEAVAGGAGSETAWGGELTGAIGSGDDAHLSMVRVGRLQ